MCRLLKFRHDLRQDASRDVAGHAPDTPYGSRISRSASVIAFFENCLAGERAKKFKRFTLDAREVPNISARELAGLLYKHDPHSQDVFSDQLFQFLTPPAGRPWQSQSCFVEALTRPPLLEFNPRLRLHGKLVGGFHPHTA